MKTLHLDFRSLFLNMDIQGKLNPPEELIEMSIGVSEAQFKEMLPEIVDRVYEGLKKSNKS